MVCSCSVTSRLFLHLPALGNHAEVLEIATAENDATYSVVNTAGLGAVYRLEAAQDLVDKVLYVVVRELLLGVDDVVQVGVEQLGDEVHVLPVLNLPAVGHHDVLQAEHVLVLEVLEQPHLAKHPLAVDRILKGIADLLDGHLRDECGRGD